MLHPRVIPVLLLKDKGLVKTTQFQNPRYVGDVVNAIHIFNDKQVDELVLLDITATIEHREPDFDRIMQIADECFVPFTYGGGITRLEQITRLIRNGCEKVIINSALSPSLLRAAADKFGSQAIVASIDYRQNQVYINGGRTPIGIDPVTRVLQCVDSGCGEVLLNSIERDGMRAGYDLELIRKVSPLCSVPLTVCGGAGSLAHFREALDCGASAVAAGSFFVFYGKQKAVLISYPTPSEKEMLEKVAC